MSEFAALPKSAKKLSMEHTVKLLRRKFPSKKCAFVNGLEVNSKALLFVADRKTAIVDTTNFSCYDAV